MEAKEIAEADANNLPMFFKGDKGCQLTVRIQQKHSAGAAKRTASRVATCGTLGGSLRETDTTISSLQEIRRRSAGTREFRDSCLCHEKFIELYDRLQTRNW